MLDSAAHSCTSMCTLASQAFRHLYALAAQPRSVDAIDVHTKQQVYVPIQISLQDPGGTTTPTAAGAARFGSALRPVLSDSKVRVGGKGCVCVCVCVCAHAQGCVGPQGLLAL
jgi:hypothetical protein